MADQEAPGPGSAPLVVRNAGGNVVICVERRPDGIFDVSCRLFLSIQLVMRRVHRIEYYSRCSLCIEYGVTNIPNCSIFYMHSVLLHDI